jgi:hypothetical protein
MTLWHGTRGANGFLFNAWPTARLDPHPIARARIPYVVTRPFGILLVALYTLSWKSVTAVAFMAGTTSGT